MYFKLFLIFISVFNFTLISGCKFDNPSSNKKYITDHPVILDLKDFKNTNKNEADQKQFSKLDLKSFSVIIESFDKETVRSYKDGDVSYTVLSGSVYIGSNEDNKEIVLTEGMVYLVPSGIKHVFRPAGNKPAKLLIHLGE